MKQTLLFIVRRIAEFVISLALLAFVIFSLLYIAPGDPARSLVGTRLVTPELIEEIREAHHLNDPFFVQFKNWIGEAFSGNFGVSIRTGQPVTEYVGYYTSATFQLVGLALVFSILLGIVCGVASAKTRGKLTDKAIDLFALIGTSAPSFAIGLFFLYLFAYRLGLFPIHGMSGDSFLSNLPSLILPALTLTIGVSALLIKITRTALLAEINKDYATFMRARSLKPLRITMVQMKNASAPILTSTGLLLASLFGGTVLVESVFSLPGLGNLLASSVTFHDVPVVQFIALMLAFLICSASAAVDILVYVLNPLTHRRKMLSDAALRAKKIEPESDEGAGI